MKKILLTIIAAFFITGLYADEESKNAIYVWVDGTSICYKLDGMPQVTYNNGSAILTLSGKTTPELTLDLTNGAQLQVTYGIYRDATGIESVNSNVLKNGKYITGGKLIIIKDGKKYNTDGIEIN